MLSRSYWTLKWYMIITRNRDSNWIVLDKFTKIVSNCSRLIIINLFQDSTWTLNIIANPMSHLTYKNSPRPVPGFFCAKSVMDSCCSKRILDLDCSRTAHVHELVCSSIIQAIMSHLTYFNVLVMRKTSNKTHQGHFRVFYSKCTRNILWQF